MSGTVDSSVHTIYPVHVLLDLNQMNGQAKPISGRCDDTDTPN